MLLNKNADGSSPTTTELYTEEDLPDESENQEYRHDPIIAQIEKPERQRLLLDVSRLVKK